MKNIVVLFVLHFYTWSLQKRPHFAHPVSVSIYICTIYIEYVYSIYTVSIYSVCIHIYVYLYIYMWFFSCTNPINCLIFFIQPHIYISDLNCFCSKTIFNYFKHMNQKISGKVKKNMHLLYTFSCWWSEQGWNNETFFILFST